jgi:hypothetical protein
MVAKEDDLCLLRQYNKGFKPGLCPRIIVVDKQVVSDERQWHSLLKVQFQCRQAKCQVKLVSRSVTQSRVLEVTARSAANILDVQPNTAMLFYRKIRQVISHHVELQATQIFDGAVELDESYLTIRILVCCTSMIWVSRCAAKASPSPRIAKSLKYAIRDKPAKCSPPICV